MNKIVKTFIVVPNDIMQKIKSGKYTLEGSVVRNKQGKIVHLLKEVPCSEKNSVNKIIRNASNNTLKRVSNSSETSLVKTNVQSNVLGRRLIGIGVIFAIGTLVVVTYKNYQKSKNNKQNIEVF